MTVLIRTKGRVGVQRSGNKPIRDLAVLLGARIFKANEASPNGAALDPVMTNRGASLDRGMASCESKRDKPTRKVNKLTGGSRDA